jgi:DNA-binding IclR family transcriptional regulator
MRLTHATQMVVNALLTEPAGQWYGQEVIRSTDLPSGTVYPILARMERHGWLVSRVADTRPPRRFYTLTDLFPHPKAEV